MPAVCSSGRRDQDVGCAALVTGGLGHEEAEPAHLRLRWGEELPLEVQTQGCVPQRNGQSFKKHGYVTPVCFFITFILKECECTKYEVCKNR